MAKAVETIANTSANIIDNTNVRTHMWDTFANITEVLKNYAGIGTASVLTAASNLNPMVWYRFTSSIAGDLNTKSENARLNMISHRKV